MGGLEGPPKPPALGRAPAEPWRSSNWRGVLGASTGAPSPIPPGAFDTHRGRESTFTAVLRLRDCAIFLAGLGLLCAVMAGCSTASSQATRSEFEDIPVANGLTYLPNKSTIIESPTVKAARLLYRGRVDVDSLAVAMRNALESNGWRHVSSTSTADHGITQVYDKAGNPLEVRLIDDWWFTYVELTVSRTRQ